jgi:hypothetical protein
MTKKQQIALRLASGECGGSYGEAVLILCSALNALAAEVLPGEGIDRKRFVELLKEYAPPQLSATRISIPLLVGRLRTAGMNTESKRIEKAFLNFCASRVLTGDKIDKTEEEILAVCNTVSSKDIRECSYANLLYREVRSSYAHEYRSGKRADPWPMTQESNAHVSYGNWVDDPDRHIHFHVGWISELAIRIAQAVDGMAAALPRTKPTRWWIEG